MGTTVKSTNNIPRLRRALNELGKKTIKVGVFGSDNYEYGNDADLVTIARVHEFGMTIKPVEAQWLTIPLIPVAKGKRAGDFELFFYQPDGEEYALLARERSNGNIENVFLLLKSVEIPERSFLRSGFDQNVDEITDKIEKMLNDVIALRVDPDTFADEIGREFAGLIQKHTKRLSNPPNSSITSNVKQSSNPLNDTGNLIRNIRHEVE